MVHPSQQQQLYPRRRAAPSVTIASGGRTRTFKVRPLAAALTLGGFALLATAYVGATAYLVYRDDLLGTAITRQVEMQFAYEERLAALRTELDRVSSRHMVQAESLETQVATLLERQADISERQSALDGLVEKARAAGLGLASNEARVPRSRPSAKGAAPELGYAPSSPAVDHMITGSLFRSEAAADEGAAVRPVLAEIRSELDQSDTQQSSALQGLGSAAGAESARLHKALSPLGIAGGGAVAPGPQGGPYVPADGLHFVERTAIIERMLDDLAALRASAVILPVARPVHSTRISSRFGSRRTPS